MNWLDLVIILIVLLSAAAGFKRGFIRIGIGFVAVVVGFILAAWFYGLAAHAVAPYVATRAFANIIGFLVIFACVMALGALLTMVMTKLFNIVGLSWLDRVAGGTFGLVRGALVATILVMLFAAFTPGRAPAAIVQSEIAPHLIEASSVLAALTPNEIKSGFRKTYDEAKKLWKDAMRKKSKKLPEHEI